MVALVAIFNTIAPVGCTFETATMWSTAGVTWVVLVLMVLGDFGVALSITSYQANMRKRHNKPAVISEGVSLSNISVLRAYLACLEPEQTLLPRILKNDAPTGAVSHTESTYNFSKARVGVAQYTLGMFVTTCIIYNAISKMMLDSLDGGVEIKG